MSLIPAPAKYAQAKGNAALVYDAICQTLASPASRSDRQEQADWQAFSQTDWNLFAQMAEGEGVAPLLYWKLKDGPSTTLRTRRLKDEMPAEVQRFLQSSYYQTAAHNQVLFNELARILTAFAEAEIPVIVLKGAALAQTIYPDPGLRPMGDLDVLVPATHLYQAGDIARQLGYAETIPEAGKGLKRLLSLHLEMRKVENPERIALEIHDKLIGGESFKVEIPTDWFWQHSQGSVRSDQHVSIPPTTNFLQPEAELLYLCAHLMLQHGGGRSRLLWHYDLHQLILAAGEDLDWQQFERMTKELNWEPVAHAALDKVRKLFGTPVPVKSLDRLLGGEDTPIGRLVAQRQVGPKTRLASEWQTLAGFSWGARFRLGWALLFPSPAYMYWRYQPKPRWLWPVYYVYRWIDIARDWGLGVFLAWKKERG